MRFYLSCLFDSSFVNVKKFSVLTGFFLSILCVFLHSSGVLAQERPSIGEGKVDTLALVNGNPITSEDFRNRFELSIYPGEDYRDTTKMEFLYSLIAEKLLSEAAAGSADAVTPEEKVVEKEMREVFLRDALYRSQVLPNAKATREELSRGLKLSTYSYVVDAFYLPDSIYAEKFYDILSMSGKNDVYRLVDSLSVSHDTLKIGYGESTPLIEDAFFGHTKSFISKPVFTVDGWIVFRVIDRVVNTKFASAAPEDRTEMVRKIIVGRNENILGGKYLLEVMKGARVSVNYAIFRPLVYAIQKLIIKKQPDSFDPYYYLSPQDLLLIKEEFASELSHPMLSFDRGEISLASTLDELPFTGFHSVDTTIPQITLGLHSALRFIAQNYFLAKKAVQLGLENSGEVKYNVEMFLDAVRSSRMAKEIMDTVTVTQGEVDKFFENHQDEVLNSVELKLKTFEALSVNEAVDTYDRLLKLQKAGVVDTSGTWTTASHLGEIGGILAGQPNGAIYGPLFNDKKFVIYQVIDKKSRITEDVISHSIDVAKEMLLESKKEEVMNRYIANLAEKAGVKFFYGNVRSLQITPIEMLTFRYIGFGGRILAVPMLYPREGWIKYYENKKPPVP